MTENSEKPERERVLAINENINYHQALVSNLPGILQSLLSKFRGQEHVPLYEINQINLSLIPSLCSINSYFENLTFDLKETLKTHNIGKENNFIYYFSLIQNLRILTNALSNPLADPFIDFTDNNILNAIENSKNLVDLFNKAMEMEKTKNQVEEVLDE